MTYAFHNGRRWVVLSNGRDWRLYDSTVQGLASDRFVAQATLEDTTSFEEFLKALGKESVCSGGLEIFARHAWLSAFLQGQIADENSPVIKSIWNIARNQQGLVGVSRAEVVAYFKGAAPIPISPPTVTPTNGGESEHTPPSVQGGFGLDFLRDHAKEYATGNKPATLIFPDGSQVSITKWKDFVAKAVQWIGDRKSLPPLPYKGGRSKDNFLHSAPQHETEPMRAYEEITINGQKVYVDTARSAKNIIQRLCELCEIVGIAPSGFVVILKE
jgi:hypothetical protein